jgi:flavin reductase
MAGPVPDGDDLRDVMRRFPSGVAVVTVNVDGNLLGQTVSALVSLSLDPPLVGISIARQAQLHELLREAGGFAVSLLAGGQEWLSQHFARSVPPIAMWHGVAHHEGAEGAPLLAGAIGWLECRLWSESEVGDHTLFVGEVLAAELGENAPPLVHVGSEYRALA